MKNITSIRMNKDLGRVFGLAGAAAAIGKAKPASSISETVSTGAASQIASLGSIKNEVIYRPAMR